MPNITAVLNEQIRRLAGREIVARTKTTRKLTAHYRRDIAALKRQVASLTKVVGFLEKQEKKRVASQPVPQEVGDVRFRADGLRSHRAKLGLSTDNYGRLAGVSGMSIQRWESGKVRPRKAQVAMLAAVRGIGKREAEKRLELVGDGAAVAKPQQAKPRPRGQYKQTATEFVASLLKGRKAMTTAEINAAWKKSGRGGVADDTLSLMVKAKKLKRAKVKHGRGSMYRAG